MCLSRFYKFILGPNIVIALFIFKKTKQCFHFHVTPANFFNLEAKYEVLPKDKNKYFTTDCRAEYCM